MHAISSYRGNRPANTRRPPAPQIGLITIHCAAASLARIVIKLCVRVQSVKVLRIFVQITENNNGLAMCIVTRWLH